MIKMKYIVSGTYKEYEEFMYKHRDDINVVYQYVDSPKTLKGLTNIEGFYIGTYYKRHDIGEIKAMIKMSKAVVPANNEYTVEHVTALDNNHVIEYSALDSVYGNVTQVTLNYKEINDNAMIDSMRDRD
jgi:hypothetical protein